MATTTETLTEFTIRRNVFTLFGATFKVYNREGEMIATCRQKAFKLKEDIRLYRDEAQQEELAAIKARSIVDWGASYDVVDSDKGEKVGALRRKGMASIIRDEWLVLDPDDIEIGRIQEDSTAMALLRRFLSNLIPQTFHLRDNAGNEVATFRTHFNPFVHRMTVTAKPNDAISNFLVLATGFLLMAIEGRQD